MITPSRNLLLKQYLICRRFRSREYGPERLARDAALRQLRADIRRLPRTRRA